MSVKEEVIKMIETLPESITVSDIMAERYFSKKLTKAGRHSMKEKASAMKKPKSC